MSKKPSRHFACAASYLIACLFWLARNTLRRNVTNDRRIEILNVTGKKYIFAILHAHQLSALALSDNQTGTVVSRSRDGDMLVPLLKICKCVPLRGSNGVGAKGGATVILEMVRHLDAGQSVVIAVDGPRGPRNKVQPGAAMVSHKANVPVLPVILAPKRRWIMTKSWDRLQIFKPFSEVLVWFGEPIFPELERAGDLKSSVAEMSQRIEDELRRMERLHDPEEAAIAQPATQVPSIRLAA